MFFVYNLLVIAAEFLLKIIAKFNPKMKLFVEGRKDVIPQLQAAINQTDRTIWFHAASLGEYEQGLPVIEQIKEIYPLHKIVLTFFSPSGYEVRKNNTVADLTIYLPLDTTQNARRFLDALQPELAFFIKYEFWPNYLHELRKQKTRTFLISGIFRESQPFFKWFGGFYRKALQSFEHFFVQNDTSKKLLTGLGYTNITVSGDTRFDRVAHILEKDNALPFIEEFLGGKLAIVVGSSWPKDESLLVNYINGTSHEVKFIVAPHNIKADQIAELQNSIERKTVLFSEMGSKNLAEFEVFIIDTIGILTKIYSYADIAYVGGGFGNPGVHNILEPATFGIPIVIGPNYSHFEEATALVKLGGCLSISNQQSLNESLDSLIVNADIRSEKGNICSTFVQMNKNATDTIINYIGAAK
ncbi:MAG: 3-deoxy-D-manno-octulosonic acid transferase [Flavobacterium sp.]|nr:3-deoxy-D-manno-octulosonic acid transferase [Flavobacterium sp.]